MTASAEHDTGGTSSPTPHEMVRNLERSIVARLSEAEAARDEVTRAEAQAAALLVKAEAQGAETGRTRAEAILGAARAEAGRLADEGVRAATDLASTAKRCRDDDVTTVLTHVLPQGEV